MGLGQFGRLLETASLEFVRELVNGVGELGEYRHFLVRVVFGQEVEQLSELLIPPSRRT